VEILVGKVSPPDPPVGKSGNFVHRGWGEKILEFSVFFRLFPIKSPYGYYYDNIFLCFLYRAFFFFRPLLPKRQVFPIHEEREITPLFLFPTAATRNGGTHEI
jgi:hypothetical protein